METNRGHSKIFAKARALSIVALYMHFLSDTAIKLKVCRDTGHAEMRRKYNEIPFEEIIFEEAGFLPASNANVITVSVDGHIAVSFPADTDVAVVAKFIKKMGKEASHVEP